MGAARAAGRPPHRLAPWKSAASAGGSRTAPSGRDLSAATKRLGFGDAGEHRDELVATEPRSKLSGLEVGRQDTGGLHDQPIPGGIAERIVGGLQAVEVE